jgi:hypothetical protein
MTRNANLVFTEILRFWGGAPLSKHAFRHSYHPFLLFLVQIIVFYKMDWASLMEIEVSPIEALASFVAY